MVIDIFSAISLNGVMSPKEGESSLSLIKTLNVPKEILDLQYETRRAYDAVMVGTSTVIIDNPKLISHTKIKGEAVRITFDPYEKLSKDCFFLDGTEKTYIGLCKCTNPDYLKFLNQKGIITIIAGDTRINFPEFFSELEKKGISSVLVEGGGKLNYELLKENLISNIRVLFMPLVLNDKAPNFFSSNRDVFKKLKLIKSERIGDYSYLVYRV